MNARPIRDDGAFSNSSSTRRQMWMLVVLLGLALIAMRQLRQQRTVDRLGRLFGLPPGLATSYRAESDGLSLTRQQDAHDALERSPTEGRSGAGLLYVEEARPPEQNAKDAWAAVEDNALFLPQEEPAWVDLLRRAQITPQAELDRQSLGEIAYAQLRSQPQVYRGKSLRVSGTALRALSKPAPSNLHGIERYFQVTLAPRGGGEWPIVAYCIELPDRFPRGQSIRADVQVDGFFFKNWSYSYGDGMGVAPVLVAANLTWRPRADSAPGPVRASAPSAKTWMIAIITTAFFAGLVAWRATVRTRRRPHLRNVGAVVDVQALQGRDGGADLILRRLDQLSSDDSTIPPTIPPIALSPGEEPS